MTGGSSTHGVRRKSYLGIALMASFIALFACGPVSEETSSTENSTDNSEEIAVQDNTKDVSSSVLATGSFEGRSDHVVSGSVEIVEKDGKHFIELGENFSLDNAPDPKVGLGKDGYDPSTKSGDLAAMTGASSYEVPNSIDIQAYNEVFIWCEKFDVPLGVAQLQAQ